MPASSTSSFVAEPARPTIVMTRLFDAPRGLVFEAITRPEHLVRWWGPRRTQLVTCEVDLRPGGAYRYVLRMPDGREAPFSGTYREIVPPSRLVFTERFEPVDAPPSVVTIELVEVGVQTRLELSSELASVALRDAVVATGMRAGAEESHDRLGELLDELVVRGTELVISRELAAPRALVYAAFTQAEHLPRWWGPRGFTLDVHDLDVRPGGRFRHTMRGPDGSAYPWEGTYREVVANERLAFDSVIHEGVRVATVVTFAEAGGKTTVTVRQTYSKETAATRGAREGWKQSLDRLVELLPDLR